MQQGGMETDSNTEGVCMSRGMRPLRYAIASCVFVVLWTVFTAYFVQWANDNWPSPNHAAGTLFAIASIGAGITVCCGIWMAFEKNDR